MKLLETKEKEDTDSGITLLALVVTIIVLLILAGVTLSQISGDNGILTQSKRAVITNEFSKYQEEFEMFKTSKTMDNAIDTEGDRFSLSSLSAGKYVLYYNTIPDDEKNGTIKNVIPSISDKYIDYFQIIKGELLFNSDDNQLTKIASDLGIKQSPWDIVAGRLLSSDKNLALQDNDGTITIPATVTSVEEGAFANVDVKKVIIPYTVKEIKQSAFASNDKIIEVEIQTRTKSDGTIEGCEKIGDSAFSKCSLLTKITIPTTVKEIGAYAFSECISLPSIEIPGRVSEIKIGTFSSCYNLKEIKLEEGINKIDTGAMPNINVKKLTIPSTVNKIESNALTYLTADLLEIKSKDINLAGNALRGAIIKKVDIPENGNLRWASDNYTLMNTKNDNEVVFIYYSNIYTISEYKIPDGVKNWAFQLPRNITKIVIPASLETIDTYTIWMNVEDIDTSKSSRFVTLSINKNNDRILFERNGDSELFLRAYLRAHSSDINIPNIIIDQGKQKKIKKVSNNGLINISEDNIVNKLTIDADEIESGIFAWYTHVNELDIGRNVSKIDSAFIPTSDDNDDNFNFEIVVDSANTRFYAKDKILYERNETGYTVKNIILRPKEGENITINIPKTINNENVTTIGGRSFWNQNTITYLNIPDTITNIEAYKDNSSGRTFGPFNNCKKLKEVTIPKSVTKICNECFAGCSELEKINMPTSEKNNKIEGAPWSTVIGMRAIKWKN